MKTVLTKSNTRGLFQSESLESGRLLGNDEDLRGINQSETGQNHYQKEQFEMNWEFQNKKSFNERRKF